MTIRKLLFTVGLIALAISACDLINRTSAQVQAKKVIAATLLHTPAIEVRPEAIAGFDAGFLNQFDAGGFDGSIPFFDGGLPFDAGGFLNFDGGFSIIIPEQTAVFGFFGTRNGEGLSQEAPTAIAGATLSLTQKGGSELMLKEVSGNSGTFQLSSNDEKALTYVAKATYTFTARAENQTFVGIVEEVPEEERIEAFHPANKNFLDLEANADFTFARPDPPNGKERNLAFVLVVPLDREGKQGEPTYTNVPQTALGLLKLAVAPSEWKTTTVKVPGKAFPEKDKNYLLLLQSAKLGRPDSDNLFLGSALIAGTAEIAIVKTH